MIRFFLFFLFFYSSLFSNEFTSKKVLDQEIKKYITPWKYNKNKDFIKIIFLNKIFFYTNNKIDDIKIIQKLKDNGLLSLFFSNPKELKLSFTTNGSPIFFLKIMRDTLRNIGYYSYTTRSSNKNLSEFTWKISLTAEYATDPLILQAELKKSGCTITKVERNSLTDWSYVIDTSRAFLNVKRLEHRTKVKLKRSRYAHWLDISRVSKIRFVSRSINNWHPHIVYYDSSLNILKFLKVHQKTSTLSINLPIGAKYMKVSDLHTLKNIKEPIHLAPL